MEEGLKRASVVRLQSAWILTGTGNIHSPWHADFNGLDALVHTNFAKEWKLQIQVTRHLTELKQELANGFGCG